VSLLLAVMDEAARWPVGSPVAVKWALGAGAFCRAIRGYMGPRTSPCAASGWVEGWGMCAQLCGMYPYRPPQAGIVLCHIPPHQSARTLASWGMGHSGR